MLVGQLITQAEALVLPVAEDLPALDVGGPAIIAWDGSETAMHAVQRVLVRARSVTVFQAGALTEEAISAADVAA